MVEVTYYRREHRLTAKGHAGGEKGRDIVCAAVSTLVLTLAANVAELALSDKLCHHTLELKEGDSRISCAAVSGMGPVVTMIFDAVCSGFELIQTLHPEGILYRIAG